VQGPVKKKVRGISGTITKLKSMSMSKSMKMKGLFQILLSEEENDGDDGDESDDDNDNDNDGHAVTKKSSDVHRRRKSRRFILTRRVNGSDSTG